MKSLKIIIATLCVAIIGACMFFACEKEFEKTERTSNKINNCIQKETIEQLSAEVGFSVEEFAYSSIHIDFDNSAYDLFQCFLNGDFFVITDDAYLIVQGLSTPWSNLWNDFESEIGTLFPEFVTLEPYLKDQVIDTAEDMLCCGDRIKGYKKFLRTIDKLEDEYSTTQMSYEEYKAQYNAAVAKLNNKNNRIVIEPIP